MSHFEQILRQQQSLIPQHFHQHQQIYDKSTNQSNLMSTAIQHGHSPFDSSPRPSLFFFSVNSPRQNADKFQFNQQNGQFRNLYKEHVQTVSRRLEFQEDPVLFNQEEELEEEEMSVKEEEWGGFESSETLGKGKKIKKSKSSKGLKNLSIGVYDIVAQKSQTSYKEVANSLINKLNMKGKQPLTTDQMYQPLRKGEKDEHNIKRRVYDALNVLISAQLLRKEGKKVICNYNLKKQNSHRAFLQGQHQRVNEHFVRKQQILVEKRLHLQQLRRKFAKIQHLITKNRLLGARPEVQTISLPFIITQGNIDDMEYSIGSRDVNFSFKGGVMIMGDIGAIEEMAME